MIQIQDLHKSFDSHEVLKGIDLDIPKGCITVILGFSGGGKSVLMRNMIGLVRPDKGRILVAGTDMTQLDERALNQFRKHFGMLFQNAALFDSLTVEENIAFPLKEHTDKSPEDIKRLVNEKLELVGLPKANDKYPSELSGGMRKRVGLARAIALEPQIILYDEPTTGLDPLTADTINQLIVSMRDRLHVTSVVISHDIESTFQVADQVAMLYEGKIIECGPPAQFRRSRHDIVQRFIRQGLSQNHAGADHV